METTPFINRSCLLEKFSGKGGWTYAALPEIPNSKNNPFGWLKVAGTIDDYVIQQYHLMPMGNGCLFLPVKAAIRKAIGKQAGDSVWVTLYVDNSATETLPEDFAACLSLDADAEQFFNTLSQQEQFAWTKWIQAATAANIREERMAIALQQLAQHQLFSTWKNKLKR